MDFCITLDTSRLIIGIALGLCFSLKATAYLYLNVSFLLFFTPASSFNDHVDLKMPHPFVMLMLFVPCPP